MSQLPCMQSHICHLTFNCDLELWHIRTNFLHGSKALKAQQQYKFTSSLSINSVDTVVSHEIVGLKFR